MSLPSPQLPLTGLDDSYPHLAAIPIPLHDLMQAGHAEGHTSFVPSVPEYNMSEHHIQPTAGPVSVSNPDSDGIASASWPTFLRVDAAHLGSQILRPKRGPELLSSRFQHAVFDVNGTTGPKPPISTLSPTVSFIPNTFRPRLGSAWHSSSGAPDTR
jgi:hypothetical protein